MIKEGEEVPEIYQDPAYSRTSHWELSTSQLSSKYLDGKGYGEGPCDVPSPRLVAPSFLPLSRAVVPDGYGLSYTIGDDYIQWTITSRKLDTDKFKDYLVEAATETRQMMERAGRTDGTKTKS